MERKVESDMLQSNYDARVDHSNDYTEEVRVRTNYKFWPLSKSGQWHACSGTGEFDFIWKSEDWMPIPEERRSFHADIEVRIRDGVVIQVSLVEITWFND